MAVPYDRSRHNAEQERANRLARITDEEIVNAVQEDPSKFREMLRLHHRNIYDKHIVERRKFWSRKKYFLIPDKASFLNEARDLYRQHVINTFGPLPSDFNSRWPDYLKSGSPSRSSSSSPISRG